MEIKQDCSITQLCESISPYQIWIAEVMLQKTQLKVVILYCGKMDKGFSTLTDLENVLMIC